MKKKVLLTLSCLALLMVGGIWGGQAWLKGRLEKSSLVKLMENAWNCRAHLDDTSVSLFSTPATVKLLGLKLAPRDEQIAQPLDSRLPLATDAATITAGEVVLSIQLTDLLSGTLNIERLHIDGLNVRNKVDEQGHGDLEGIFHSSPEEVATTTNEPLPEPAPITFSGSGASTAPVADSPPPPTQSIPAQSKPIKVPKPDKAEKSGMAASELRINLAVKSADITNGHFESVDLKGRTHTTIKDITFALTDIDIAPGDLANHNRCHFALEAKLRVEKDEPKSVLADFALTGSGDLAPFDTSTGLWNPDTDLAVTLRKGGLLGGTMLEKQMGKKDLEKLKEYGVQLGDIAIGGILQEDAITQIHALPGGKMIVKQDTTLAFQQYQITVLEKTWFNAPADQHSAKAKLTVSPELTIRILSDAEKALKEKFGTELLAKAAIALVRGTLMDSQKRLVLPFKAKGSMSKPAVDTDLDAALKNVQDLLKDQGANLLKGLLGE